MERKSFLWACPVFFVTLLFLTDLDWVCHCVVECRSTDVLMEGNTVHNTPASSVGGAVYQISKAAHGFVSRGNVAD